ncbi:ATP-binding protein [Heyndrickxia vini]|uniref:histidine kinase n=1 Tax=Heyndrickxia vini TaxID=1476025 RepID=A0ABX7E7E8_9BACI|nr:ATP-binding protein [Heyndrickxia vini]QQZ11240.1 PAS domain S-box protein [Heyndrickxia vini]
MNGVDAMFGKFTGRIVATTFFVFAVTLWNSIFYGYYNYHFNMLLDLSYTIILAAIVWWIASYYDHSKFLLKNLTISEEKYKKLLDETNYVFNNLNQVVYQTDNCGNFIMLNPTWENLTGFTFDESIGVQLQSFVYHEDQFIADNIYNNNGTSHMSIRKEIRFRKNSGGFVWVELNMKYNYDVHNNLLSTVGTLTDITERKFSEQELLQLNEDLTIQSEKLSVIAQLSAAIAHEVRNPLTSISGFLQLLKERKELDLEYIRIIFSEIERIELVLGELLMLSKPQSVSFQTFDILKTIDYVVALLISKANMDNVEINNHKSAEPLWIYGDENQLKQVLINILKNAMESIGYNGKIEIVQCQSNNFVSLYIKDTGCGISEELLTKIGQPFYTTKEKGTGLGLTTCFKIIENHKGKIHISSQLGIGTTFEIILPINEMIMSNVNHA